MKSKVAKDSAASTVGAETISHRAELPSRIGRFTVLAKLGEGAFGAVYKAHDPQLEREVAVKIQKSGAFANADERERFLREARSAAAIQHPNICPIFEVNAEGDALYIVMAYVPGASLADQLRGRRSPLPAKQSALIVRKLAQALHAAHCKGVIHRDLKPGNILFDKERKDVVITDFGLARRTQSTDVELTQVGAILGTPAYMSPEQARGDVREVGPASDIYSLGVILYELLTGKKPFTGSIGEVLGKVQHVAPEPPSKLKKDIDPRLERICLKAMAKAPKERFGSMREFAYQLGEYLKDAPTGAVQTGVPDAKPGTAAPNEAAQMAEIIAAMSLERKAEAKTVEQSQRKLGRLVLGVGGCLGSLMLMALCSVASLGVWLYHRADNTPNGPIVSVMLKDITHLHDNSVHYYLNGTKIDSKELEGPLELPHGEYTLEGKRDGEIVEERKFNVTAETPQQIVPVVVEEELPVGPVHDMKIPGLNYVYQVAVSPDGQWILSAACQFDLRDEDRTLFIWNAKTGKREDSLSKRNAQSLAFAPTGKTAFVGVTGQIPLVLQYDLSKPKFWTDVRQFDFPGNGHSPYDLQVSRDGSQFLLGVPDGANSRIIVQPIRAGKPSVALSGFAGCFTPEGNHVFTNSGNTNVVMYDIRGEKPVEVRSFKGHTSNVSHIACSPDGKTLAASSTQPANAIRTWEVNTGKPLQTLIPHGNEVSSVCFSPDGSRLMTAGWDGILRIYDVKSWREIYATLPQGNAITCAVYSPGGRRAIFGMNGGTVKVWQLGK